MLKHSDYERLLVRGRSYDSGLVEQALLEHLRMEIKDPPKLSAIAARFCVSSRTFSRRLKAMGKSYRGLLEEMRRSEAVDRLVNSDCPIYEIAGSLGYSDVSNFCKAFKSWTGYTPVLFRKSHSQSRKHISQ